MPKCINFLFISKKKIKNKNNFLFYYLYNLHNSYFVNVVIRVTFVFFMTFIYHCVRTPLRGFIPTSANSIAKNFFTSTSPDTFANTLRTPLPCRGSRGRAVVCHDFDQVCFVKVFVKVSVKVFVAVLSTSLKL